MQSEPLGYTGARACLIEWGKPSCLLAMQLCNSLPLHFSDIFRKSGQQISYRHLMGDDSLLTSVNFDIQLTPPLELCPSLKSQWNALWTNVCVCDESVFLSFWSESNQSLSPFTYEPPCPNPHVSSTSPHFTPVTHHSLPVFPPSPTHPPVVSLRSFMWFIQYHFPYSFPVRFYVALNSEGDDKEG